MAPDVGFEPTTNRLTADYSTAELIRNLKSKAGILLKNEVVVKSLHFYFIDVSSSLHCDDWFFIAEKNFRRVYVKLLR